MTERQAYVARHRFIPGAFAYINAQQVEATGDTRTLERWLAQGATVAKVPLDQAVRELQEHIAARNNPAEQELPMFLRKQAD